MRRSSFNRPLRPLVVAVGLVLGASVAPGVVGIGTAEARSPTARELEALAEEIQEAETLVAAAEEAARSNPGASEVQLAKRLVEGELRLAEGDYEGAAIVFLDLIENHRASQAGPQAVYYLGDALKRMGLVRWASEQFSYNLADRRTEARRYHQRSVARLFELSAPPREAGFAREPGLSATPEARARLQAMGLDTSAKPPGGLLEDRDAAQLEQWAESFPVAKRTDELTYAYGRYLYLRGQHEKARKVLQRLVPGEEGFVNRTHKGVGRDYTIRAAYVAAAATLALGNVEEAVERYSQLANAKPLGPNETQIFTLSWMALARIAHDQEDWDEAIRAYREVSRDSPFFSEALYETAWTLLRAGRHERAVQALDLLLVYKPDSSLRPEIQQLQGKIKIQQGDYKEAENRFLTLRREFSDLAAKLGNKLAAEGDASAYFASVVGEDLEHFSIGEIVPATAVPFVQGLPAAKAAGKVTHTLGEAERMLFETRSLLAKMEEAVAAPEKARLFTELSAHVASLDTVENVLIELQEKLVIPSRRESRRGQMAQMEAERQALRSTYDQPLGKEGLNRARVVENARGLEKLAHKQGLLLAALRAQLVAAEQYFERTRGQQRIDQKAFLRQAAELRDEIAKLEEDLATVRAKIDRVESSLRFRDPWRAARRQASNLYRTHLETMYGSTERSPGAAKVWATVKSLEQRISRTRAALNQTATVRLRYAVKVLTEERANLDDYLAEARTQHEKSTTAVGEVLAASYRDVVAELRNLVIRSEVGLLDVAWALKQEEVDKVDQLERDRERDMAEIDSAVELGLEELGR